MDAKTATWQLSAEETLSIAHFIIHDYDLVLNILSAMFG